MWCWFAWGEFSQSSLVFQICSGCPSHSIHQQIIWSHHRPTPWHPSTMGGSRRKAKITRCEGRAFDKVFLEWAYVLSPGFFHLSRFTSTSRRKSTWITQKWWHMFSRGSLVTYICHPGIPGSLWFSLPRHRIDMSPIHQTNCWEALQIFPHSFHNTIFHWTLAKTNRVSIYVNVFDAPYFSQTFLKHKKTFQSWSSQLQINLKSVRNHGWKGSTSWVAKNPQRWNWQPLSWLQETSHIDSYRFMSLQVYLTFCEALNFTPTRPGMIIRTFRSGLFGLTRRMVMAIPLSLQYGNLSQAAYPSKKRPLIQDNNQIIYRSYM